jgi:membrane protein
MVKRLESKKMFSFHWFVHLRPNGYLDLGKRVYHKVIEAECSEHAAAMAFYFLFATFPFFLFLTSVIGYLHIPHLQEYVLNRAERLLPGQLFDLLQDNILALFNSKKRGLLSLGFLLALWASSKAVISMMKAMNKLYAVKEGRSFWKVRVTAFFLVIGLSILFFLALILIMFGTKIGSHMAAMLNLGVLFRITWNLMIVPLVLLLLLLAVATFYFFAPDVKQKWKWITSGTVFAISTWIGASFAFSYYINNFSSYDRTYGSLGAVIILLMWLYISGFIILVGAFINEVIEHGSDEREESI